VGAGGRGTGRGAGRDGAAAGRRGAGPGAVCPLPIVPESRGVSVLRAALTSPCPPCRLPPRRPAREALGQFLGAYRAGHLTPTGAQLAAGPEPPAPAGDAPPPAAAVSDAELEEAVAWAGRHCGGVSLRAAAMFARFFAGSVGGGGGAAAEGA
jgi:hypothetical protein